MAYRDRQSLGRGRSGGGRPSVWSGIGTLSVWALAWGFMLGGTETARGDIAVPGGDSAADVVEEPEEVALPESLPPDGAFPATADPISEPASGDYLDLLVDLLLEALEGIATPGDALGESEQYRVLEDDFIDLIDGTTPTMEEPVDPIPLTLPDD